MKHNRPVDCLCCLLLLSGLSTGAASRDLYDRNWPQWRGPTGNGVALHGDPPLKWSEQENVRWKVEVPGSGHATPVVWEDRILVLTAVPAGGNVQAAAGASQAPPDRPPPGGPPDGRAPGGRGGAGPGGHGGFGSSPAPTQEYAFTTICLDCKTGGVLWEKVGRKEVPHEGVQRSNTFASSSAVTDGQHVYSFFGSRGLCCYDLEGNLAWEKDLGKMRTRNGFGEGASPALHDGVLVVPWDNEGDSFVYGFEAKTGKQLWQQARDERTG